VKAKWVLKVGQAPNLRSAKPTLRFADLVDREGEVGSQSGTGTESPLRKACATIAEPVPF